MRIVTINIFNVHVRGFKLLQDAGIYPSRSEAIRVATRDFLQEYTRTGIYPEFRYVHETRYTQRDPDITPRDLLKHEIARTVRQIVENPRFVIYEGARGEIITINIPVQILTAIRLYTPNTTHANRSEFIRDATNRFLVRELVFILDLMQIEDEIKETKKRVYKNQCKIDMRTAIHFKMHE